jgi:GGDEF domain-containing protein
MTCYAILLAVRSPRLLDLRHAGFLDRPVVVRVTLSVSVLTVLPGAAQAQELLAYADAVMYECKRAGKNAIRFADIGDGLVTEEAP